MLTEEENKDLTRVLQDMGEFKARSGKKITLNIESAAVARLVVGAVIGILPWDVFIEQRSLGNSYITLTKQGAPVGSY
jgi:hypothetical protein